MSDVMETDFEIKTNLKDVLGAVNKTSQEVGKLANSFSQVSKQVDDIVKHIENLAAVTAKVRQTVNKTTNNSNTYKTYSSKRTTRVTASKGNEAIAVGDVVYTGKAGSGSADAKAARQAAQTALQKQSLLLDEQIAKEKELVRLEKERATLTGEKAKNYSKTVEAQSLNAQAKYLNAQTKAAHPELFAQGVTRRSMKYQTGKAFANIGDRASSFGIGGRLAGDILSVLGSTLKSPAMGFSAALEKGTTAVLDFSKAAATAFAEIEATKTQLGVVFSNQSQASAMFSDIAQYSIKSPFGVQQTSELAILLKQSGVYASDLMNTLKMLGDTAGGNMEKMKRIANNYAQIVSIGKASMLDMRQFAYAGIPIFEAVSNELGVSQQRLRKLISDGKVTSEIIEKVFKDLTGINGIFENATEKGAKTLKARMQNLADARQLGLSAVGEWGVNLGTRTGNDSVANKMVSLTENIYQWLYNKVNTINIAKNVETIANRDSKIKDLEDLIEYNKRIGNKELAKQLEEVLKQERAKSSPEKDRASLYASYQDKNARLNELRAGGETRTYSEVKQQLAEALTKAYAIGDILRQGTSADMNSEQTSEYLKSLGVDEDRLDLQYEAIQLEIETLKEIKAAFEKAASTSEKEKAAEREEYTFLTQTEMLESTNKLSDSTKSLNASFQELASIYEDSEQQKKKREEEHIKELKAAQNELKKLNRYTKDDKGTVDITKMSAKYFLSNWKGGAFKGERVDIAGKSEEQKEEIRKSLSQGLDWVVKEALSTSELNLEKQEKHLVDLVNKINSSGSDKIFFKNFASNFKEIDQTIEKAVDRAIQKLDKNSKTYKKEKEDLLLYKNLANSILGNFTLQNGGIYADPNQIGSGGAITPLWKRTLAQYTGLSASAIKATYKDNGELEASGSKNAINAYHSDVSARNLASGVFYEMFKNGDMKAIQKMLVPSGVRDSENTWLMDWSKVRDNLKEFALSLSASTKVVDAYKQGLEAELETYAKLSSEGLTAMESDTGTKRVMNAKQLAKHLQTFEDQLINPFGEELVAITKEGERVKVKETKTNKEGELEYYDKNGQKIEAENIELGVNLLKAIDEHLQETKQKVQEAAVAQARNQVLSNLLSSQMKNVLLSYQPYGRSEEARFLMQNPEQMQQLFNDSMNAQKVGTKYSGTSNVDILLSARNGDSGAVKLIQDVFDTIKKGITELVDSEEYKKLKADAYTQQSTASAQKYIQDLAFSQPWKYEDGVLSPTEYNGARGLRNRMADWWGVGKDFDMDTYYAQSVMNQGGERGQGLQKYYERRREQLALLYEKGGIDEETGTSYKGGLNSEEAAIQAKLDAERELVGLMDEEEKKAAQIAYANAESARALSDMGNTVGKSLMDAGKQAFSGSFEALGEALVTGADASKLMAANLKQVGAALLKNIGAAMTTAGFNIAGAAALSQQWGMVALGLGLAAAGGLVSGFGGALGKDQQENKSEDKISKLEKLKEDLADLLKQAQEDAIYYETTLRHKNAISANDEFKVTRVNDAVITPKGVVQTAPDDYLFATKNPQSLLGGGRGAPTINFSVIDKSTGVRVTEQKSSYNEETNQIDFEAVIESKVNEIIASSKGDEAFAARKYRLEGRQVTA